MVFLPDDIFTIVAVIVLGIFSRARAPVRNVNINIVISDIFFFLADGGRGSGRKQNPHAHITGGTHTRGTGETCDAHLTYNFLKIRSYPARPRPVVTVCYVGRLFCEREDRGQVGGRGRRRRGGDRLSKFLDTVRRKFLDIIHSVIMLGDYRYPHEKIPLRLGCLIMASLGGGVGVSTGNPYYSTGSTQREPTAHCLWKIRIRQRHNFCESKYKFRYI